jgi:hypothetical protein
MENEKNIDPVIKEHPVEEHFKEFSRIRNIQDEAKKNIEWKAFMEKLMNPNKIQNP